MTPQEIQERNKQITTMLGYVNTTPTDKDFNIFERSSKIGVIPKMIETMSMQFHSDWNWLMEAVEYIENLNVEYSVEIIRATCVIRHFNTIFSAQYFKKERDKKEAVFIAVSNFAKLYNENKL
jgi:hypothetical protein